MYRDPFVYAPSQWETTLQCNVVAHWLGAYTIGSLNMNYNENASVNSLEETESFVFIWFLHRNGTISKMLPQEKGVFIWLMSYRMVIYLRKTPGAVSI